MLNGSPTGSYSNLFLSNSSGNKFTTGNKQGFDNIIFPFTCNATYSVPSTLRISSHEVEFEIKIDEPGHWEVIINH